MKTPRSCSAGGWAVAAVALLLTVDVVSGISCLVCLPRAAGRVRTSVARDANKARAEITRALPDVYVDKLPSCDTLEYIQKYTQACPSESQYCVGYKHNEWFGLGCSPAKTEQNFGENRCVSYGKDSNFEMCRCSDTDFCNFVMSAAPRPSAQTGLLLLLLLPTVMAGAAGLLS